MNFPSEMCFVYLILASILAEIAQLKDDSKFYWLMSGVVFINAILRWLI